MYRGNGLVKEIEKEMTPLSFSGRQRGHFGNGLSIKDSTITGKLSQVSKKDWLAFSFFKNVKDVIPEETKHSWQWLGMKAANPTIRASKDGKLFSPAIYGETKQRKNENVTHWSCLALDYDHNASFADDLEPWMEYDFIAYTTHSHKRKTEKNPDAEERFRLIVRLKEPIPVEKVPALLAWAKRQSGGKIDPQTKALAQMFYMPAIADEDAEYEYEINKGKALDWKTIPIEEEKRVSGVIPIISDSNSLNSEVKEQPQTFTSWPALNQELGSRIEAHPTAKKNGGGKIDCKAICHNGQGNTGLFYDPAKNHTHCNKGCSIKTILQAFGLPTSPTKRKRKSLDAIVEASGKVKPREYALGNVLDTVLAKIKSDDTIHRLPRDQQVKFTVDKVRTVEVETNYGFRRYKQNYDYIFNGEYWYEVEEALLNEFLARAATKLGIPSLIAKHYKFEDELVKQFKRDTVIPEMEERKESLINFKNGTLEIVNGKTKLREFRRDDFLIDQFPFAYDPNAKAPMFQKFLDEVLPDKTLQDICAEFFGSCFTDIRHEAMLLLYGDGANGKSTLLRIVTQALGGKQNVANKSLTSLSGRSGEYYRAELVGKRLNISDELGARIESAEFMKLLASGDPIDARPIYGEGFTLTRLPRFAFSCNTLPKNPENTHGFFRKQLVIPFEQKIYKATDSNIPKGALIKDGKLEQRIIEQELPGVINWILQGLKRLLSTGDFTKSEKAEQANKDYRESSDSVLQFFKEFPYEPTFNKQEVIKAQELFNRYMAYCESGRQQPLGRTKFYDRVDRMGFKMGKPNKDRVFFMKPVRVEGQDEIEFEY